MASKGSRESVRKTVQDDVPKILAFMKAYFEENQGKMPMRVELNLDTCKTFFTLALKHPNVISYISDDGVILGELSTTWFGPNKVGRGVLWYVKPEARNGILARRLLKAFDDEARKRGATMVFNDLHNAANLEMIDGFVKKCGYRNYSKSYLKEF